MKEILPNIFAVEVHEDFVHGEIISMTDAVLLRLTAMNQSTTTHSEIALSPGSYEILFTTKSCTEDDVSSVRNAVVDAHFDTELQEWRYGFHENNTMIYENATDALQSLLRSHGLDENKNYLLLKKIS